jgi:UDP-GlcNAc:undecaprenyl-phosphate GlcNAc-1-phosphate transferase
VDAVASALLSFAVAGVATGIFARTGPRWGLLDPPARHKSHARPVPRCGGLAIALALAVAGAVLALEPGPRWQSVDVLPRAGFVAWGVPALGFLALGFADDRWRLRARTKLVGQVALATLAVLLGLRWGGAGTGPFPALGFGALTPVMTALWIVAVVTVVNFLDGIDLLTAATTSVALGVAAGAGAGPAAGRLDAAALGAVLGFAVWNVAPARAFVGDAGTHLLGFLVAATALEHPSGAARALPWPLVGAMLLPGVVDVAAGLVTKLRRGIPLAAPHRDHPYQRFTRLGRPHALVALSYGALVLLAAWVAARLADDVGAAVALLLGALVLAWNVGAASRAPRAPDSFFSYKSAGSRAPPP